MSDLIITPSSGKIDFIYQSGPDGQEGQTSRLESIIIDPIDGLVFSGKISASSVTAPLNVINVTAGSSNVNYPFIFASSGETGAKNLLMDSAGGTYNPSINTATIDISGNSATTTLASDSTNLGGVAAASYVTLTGTQTLTNKTITGTFTGNLTGTGSWATNAVSAVSATNSTQLNGQAASYYTNIPARLGYTPVNQAGDTIAGNLTVNGNFAVNGSFTAFSASNIYLSSSVLTVEDNILTLNAFSPYLRYAGIEMYDSGSGTLSQLLWDGEGDYFFLTGSSVNGKIITGPDGQTNLTANYIPKATAGYKLGNSLIYDSGTNIGIGITTPVYKTEIYSGVKTSAFTGLSISNFNNYDGTANSLVKSQLRFAILENPISTYDASQRTFAILESGNEANNSSSDGFFAISTRLNGAVAEKFRITSTGNTIISGSLVTTSSISAYSTITATNTLYIQKGVGGYLSYITAEQTAASTGNAFKFWNSGGSTLMTIAYDGNVGIGTTSPTSKLHVVETTATGSRIQLGSTSTNALMNTNLVNDFLILTAPFNAVPASTSNNNAKWGIKMGGGSTDAPNAREKSACIYAVSEEDSVGGLGYNRKVGLAFHTSPFDLPNVERVRINNLGNVGIGTTSPSTKLHIYENANRVTYISQNDNHTARFEAYGTATAIDTTASNGIFFRINSGDIVKFAADGNVGIGTSTATAPLHIYRASNPWIRLNGGGSFGYIRLDDGTSNGYLFKNTSSDTTNGALAGAMYTYTDSGKAFQHIHSGTPLFTILSGGNVGIGTTNPVSILDVVGLNGSFPTSSGATQSTGSIVRLRNGNSNLVLDIGGNGGNGNWLQSTNRSDLSANYPLLLNPNGGNVGIGTTIPGYKLHVYNSAATDTTLESGTSGTTGKLIFKTSDNADLNKYIMQESFYMILNGHTNEGFKFRDSAGNVLLSIFGAANAYGKRVGINTITPGAPLEVSGPSGDNLPTFKVTSTTAPNSFNYAGSMFNSSLGASKNYILMMGKAASSKNAGYIGYNHSGADGSDTNFLTFGHFSSDNLLNILGNGNVGIGTTAPATTLHVVGVISGSSFSGAGTGLTGTAANLTAGTVTTNANLTGDVTSTGNATTIASNAVTSVKIADSNVTLAKIVNISTGTILGNNGAGAAAPLALTSAQVASMLSGQTMNIGGNAATATILQTARNIGGVSFNGSADINLPGVNTSGNQNTSGNAATATNANAISFTEVELNAPATTGGTWNTGNGSQWGEPKFGTSFNQYRYADGNGPYVEYNVPANHHACFISQLQWDTGGYADCHGVQSDGDLVFLRRINTRQLVENSDHGNTIQHDGATVTFAGSGLQAFTKIRITNRSGRIHMTGIAFTRQIDDGYEGTGMVHPAQISHQGAGSGLNADLLDGYNSDTANTANTIVLRDASGNFSAGTITATLSGNVSGTAGGETFGTVTGRGSSTTTQISVGTTSGGSMYTGIKSGAGYSDSVSGATFKSITDHPTGGSYAFAAYFNGAPGTGTNSFFVAADGTGYFKGNVGIGTTTGTFTLNVYNNADVWHARFGSATGEVRIGGQTSSGAVIQSFVPGSGTVRDLYLQRDGGNVGIGTSNATAKLESYFSSNAITFNYLATNLNVNSPIPVYGFDVTSGAEARSIKAGIGYERHETNGRGTMHFYNDSTNDTQSLVGTRLSPGDIKMSINNVGSVGIGTTQPSWLLTVYASTTPQFTLQNGTRSFVLTNNSLDSLLSFNYGSVNRLQFDTTNQWFNTGNLGVGNTSPQYKLHVTQATPSGQRAAPANTSIQVDSNTNNYISFVNTADNGTYAGLTFVDNNIGGYIVFRNYTGDVTTGSDSLIYGTFQDHIFQNSSSETINGKTETMRIKQNGNVGIGSNNPQYKLDVNGGANVNGVLTFGGVAVLNTVNNVNDIYANIRVIRNTSSTSADGMYINYDSLGTTSAHLRFYANAGNERMRIQANDGHVGIGTSSAGRRLDVEGIVRTRGASGTGGFEIGAATTGAAKWRIEWDSASDSLDFNWVG